MSKTKPDEGRYSKVTRRVWVSADFKSLSAAKPNAQTLWLRILTGPELGVIPGLFEWTEAGTAERLSWPVSAVRRCLDEIISRRMAVFDRDTGVMWIPKAIQHNPPESPNVILGWKIAWKELPDSPIKNRAKDSIFNWCESQGDPWAKAFEKVAGKPFGKPSPNPSGKAIGHPSANQEQEQKQEQEQEQKPAAPTPDERFPMHRNWHLSDDMRATLETDPIPGWAIDVIERRAVAHYVADKNDIRRDLDWNRAVAKWIRGDWSDASKRPKKPEPAQQAEELPPWL